MTSDSQQALSNKISKYFNNIDPSFHSLPDIFTETQNNDST